MPELQPRDHQLYADLERAFDGLSFLLGKSQWADFESRTTLSVIDGDEESINRLVTLGKVVDLGSLNAKRHFVIKKKKKVPQ
jgi:hypothetical protein